MTDSTLAPREQTIGALQRRFASFLDSLSQSQARREQRECFAAYASGILRERGRRPLTRYAAHGLYEPRPHLLADSPWRGEPVWRALPNEPCPHDFPPVLEVLGPEAELAHSCLGAFAGGRAADGSSRNERQAIDVGPRAPCFHTRSSDCVSFQEDP